MTSFALERACLRFRLLFVVRVSVTLKENFSQGCGTKNNHHHIVLIFLHYTIRFAQSYDTNIDTTFKYSRLIGHLCNQKTPQKTTCAEGNVFRTRPPVSKISLAGETYLNGKREVRR